VAARRVRVQSTSSLVASELHGPWSSRGDADGATAVGAARERRLAALEQVVDADMVATRTCALFPHAGGRRSPPSAAEISFCTDRPLINE